MTRRPLGTQPPVVATEPAFEAGATTEPPREVTPAIEAAGTIVVNRDAAIAAHARALAADQEHAVIVQLDDDWLARLELPVD